MSRTARDADQEAFASESWELPETAAGFRGCTGRGELKLDPYDSDINSRQIYRYLCSNCEQELADEI